MLRRIGIGFAAQTIPLAVAFADRVLLAGLLLRVWGTEPFSDWATLAAAAGIIGLGELGLNVYFGNLWQRAYGDGDEARFQRLVGIALTVYSALGAALAAIIALAVLALDMTKALSLKSLTPGDAVFAFILLAGAVLLRLMRGSISQIYRGRGQFATGIVIDALPGAMTAAPTAVAVVLGAGPRLVATLYFAAELSGGWYAMLTDLRRRFPGLRIAFATPNRRELQEIIAMAAGYGLLQGMPVAWLHIPVLIMGGLGLGGSALVSFVLARTLVNLCRQIATMVALPAGVEIAGALNRGDKAKAAGLLALASRLSVVSGVIAGGLVAFSGPIIAVWTGKPELFDWPLLLILLVPMIVVAPGLLIGAVLAYRNAPEAGAVAGLCQLGIGLSAALLLFLPWGLYGMAAGLALGETIAYAVVLPALAGRHQILSSGAYLLNGATSSAIAVVWSAAVGLAACWVHPAQTTADLAGLVVAWGLLGVLPVLVATTPVREWKRLAGIGGRR